LALNNDIYDFKFYSPEIEASKKSAEKIVPIVIDLVNPLSVIDIGCGLGIWLNVFRKNGIKKILGIDCNKVETSKLFIETNKIVRCDFTKNLPIKGNFDLAVCLEVAEHLPEKNASLFIDMLISLSPVVLFSAAIPFQGGVCHVNEQWQEYWVKLFAQKNYMVIDYIRKKVWNDNDVKYWYAQNTFIFVDKKRISDYPKLKEIKEKNNNLPISIVHPEMYMKCVFMKNMSFIHLLKYGSKRILERLINRIKILFKR
jgi:SAM-dependent methyltransferase